MRVAQTGDGLILEPETTGEALHLGTLKEYLRRDGVRVQLSHSNDRPERPYLLVPLRRDEAHPRPKPASDRTGMTGTMPRVGPELPPLAAKWPRPAQADEAEPMIEDFTTPWY